MNILTHNQKHINICGTCLKGNLVCSYKTLVRLFGEPTRGDEYKTDAEWHLEIHDPQSGDVETVTIYNWKNGKSYLGEILGKDVKEISDWHIGGRSKEALRIIEVVKAARLALHGFDEFFPALPYSESEVIDV